MTRLRCHKLGRRLSFTLIAVLLIGILSPPGTMVAARAVAQAPAKTVLAFPATDESDNGTLGEVAARVTSALALAGQGTPGIDLEVFSPTSPMVRRALADGSVRSADIDAPKDAANALIMGQAFRMDSVVLLSVQSLTVTGEPRNAELAVMGTEYDVALNVDAATGAIVAEPKGNTFGVSGLAKGRPRGGGDDEALIRLAAKNAADKIMHVLAGKSVEQFVEQGVKVKKRSNLWRWLAVLIAVGGIVWATTGSDGAPPPPMDATLPTRLSARATTDGIRLTWARPTTTEKTIFKYEIQRSEDGGVFVRIDNDRLGPSATTLTDINVTAGRAYVYQIRVLYTDGDATPWVTFNQIVAP